MYMGVGSNPTSDTDFFFFFLFSLLSSYGPSPPVFIACIINTILVRFVVSISCLVKKVSIIFL